MRTPLRAGLLERWAFLARDKGVVACEFLRSGAPAGIEVFPPLDGVFPKTDELPEFVEGQDDPQSLEGEWKRDPNVDVLLGEARAHAAKGYLQECATLDEVRQCVQGEPVVSNLLMLVKNKNGLVKRRTILDAKASGVSRRTRQTHRVVLPRTADALGDALSLGAAGDFDDDAGETIEWFIADVVDAFWLVPLHPRERKYFVGQVAGRFFVYLRAAQGSRNGPLSWAAVISLAMRLLQGVLLRLPGGGGSRSQCYVDDPIWTVRGTRRQRDRHIAICLLVLQVMGFPSHSSRLAGGTKSRGSESR